MMIGTGLGMVDRDIEVGKEYRVGTFTLNGVTYDRYVKVIDCGALPNATYKPVLHGITNMVGCLQISGVARNSSGTPLLPLPYVFLGENAGSMSIRIYTTETNVYIETQYNWSAYNALVTIEYYK